MAVKNKILAIPLTSIDSSTFTGAYQVINTNGLPNACFLIRIINDSSVDITISYDGTTDNDYIRTNETLQLPLQSNAQPNNFIALIAAGTKIYVKSSAGTGLVYISGYYQPQAN